MTFPNRPAVCSLIVLLCSPAIAQKPRPRTPAQTAPAAQPHQEQPVPFRVGEKLEFDVGWSSYLTAGTATVTVQEKKPSYGSTAYSIVAEGRPTALLARLYTLYYKVDTLLDVYSLLPQRAAVYSDEGKRHRSKVTVFNQTANTATYEVQTATLVRKDLSLPSRTQDGLSALFVLRSMPLKQGDTFTMPIVNDGTVYTVQMSVGVVETVKTGMGDVQAIKVTPTIKATTGETPGSALAIWFSNDARRLPVRLEAQLLVGKFSLVIRQASGG
jgi:hypothetical protein